MDGPQNDNFQFTAQLREEFTIVVVHELDWGSRLSDNDVLDALCLFFFNVVYMPSSLVQTAYWSEKAGMEK